MELLELKDKRTLLADEVKAFVQTAKKETRQLSTDEDKSMNDKIKEIADLDKEIRAIEDADKNETTKVTKQETRELKMEKFSLLRAIKNLADGKAPDEATQRMQEIANKEFARSGITPKGTLSIMLSPEERATVGLYATDAAGGGTAVPEDKWDLLGPLYNNLVIAKAGAQIMTGLTGDVSLPVYSGTSVGWVAELSASADGGGTVSEVTLTPHRLSADLYVSKQFLAQTSPSTEAKLIADIAQAVKVKLEGAMFSETTVSNAPASLLVTPGLNDISGSITGSLWTKIIDFEEKIDAANALVGQVAYITSPKGKAILKKTAMGVTNDAQKILTNGEANGYPVYSTGNVVDTLGGSNTESAVLFANWADFLVGFWGAIDITVDPYTRLSYGQVRINVNMYADFKFQHAASVTVGSILY